MSGIAGLIAFDGEPVQASILARMAATLCRRGPDLQSIHRDRSAGFAHALLATTPEALSERQPWIHPGTGCVVVSDSRLDDRAQLLRGMGISRPPDDVGDGELLHAAWQCWGADCADRLRGDFAFVIWDPRQQTIYCARDAMGVRPFVYHFARGQRFVFGSSTEAVIAQGAVPTGIDEGRVADALFEETEGIDLTSTFYTAIQRLPPASWLLVQGDGRITSRRYWRPIGDRPDGLPRSADEWIEAQREQLDRAVRRRLRSHRAVGSMLSGGLDSSSVVALASAARAADGLAPLPVFSATNAADPDCPETRSIQAMVSQRHCRSTLVDLASMAQAPPSWWDDCGEPFDGSMTLVAQLYRESATQGVVSLLDGVPADNLFPPGRQARRLFLQGRLGDSWRAAVAQWSLPGVRHPRWHALRVMAGCLAPPELHALRDRWTDAAMYRELRAAGLASPELMRRVGMRERFFGFCRDNRDSHQWHPTEEALSSMQAPYITAALERYNRVASLFGVEPRHPFVDRDLVTFQAWVPIALRIRDGHAKWILRKAMNPLLPDEVAWRTDKSHIGWTFNRAYLANRLAHGEPDRLDDQAADWLDRARLEAALLAPDRASNQSLAAALQFLAWHRRQAEAGRALNEFKP